MNKKILSIVLVVAVVGVVYFGYQKGFFGGEGIKGIIGGDVGGIREDSLIGAMRKQGQPVVSKSKFIGECKKSDTDTQDMCYAMGAFYYRDASFCKYIKDSEAKSQCTQENIEKMYKGQEEMMREYQKELESLTPEERKAMEEQMKKMYPGGRMFPFAPGGGMFPFAPGGGMFPGGGTIPDGGTVPGGESETKEGQKDPYGSAQEIKAPNALASKVKSILGEACGGVKLTQLLHNPMDPTSKEGDILVYVWKNKPTEEKLTSAFEKEGYEIESPGSPLFVRKGNLTIVISWEEEMDSQEIGVMMVKE